MFLDTELREAIKPQRDEIVQILRDKNLDCTPIGDTEIGIVSEFTKHYYYSITLETYYDGTWVLTEIEDESSSPFYNTIDLKLHYTKCTAQDVVDALLEKMKEVSWSRYVNPTSKLPLNKRNTLLP